MTEPLIPEVGVGVVNYMNEARVDIGDLPENIIPVKSNPVSILDLEDFGVFSVSKVLDNSDFLGNESKYQYNVNNCSHFEDHHRNTVFMFPTKGGEYRSSTPLEIKEVHKGFRNLAFSVVEMTSIGEQLDNRHQAVEEDRGNWLQYIESTISVFKDSVIEFEQSFSKKPDRIKPFYYIQRSDTKRNYKLEYIYSYTSWHLFWFCDFGSRLGATMTNILIDYGEESLAVNESIYDNPFDLDRFAEVCGGLSEYQKNIITKWGHPGFAFRTTNRNLRRKLKERLSMIKDNKKCLEILDLWHKISKTKCSIRI